MNRMQSGLLGIRRTVTPALAALALSLLPLLGATGRAGAEAPLGASAQFLQAESKTGSGLQPSAEMTSAMPIMNVASRTADSRSRFDLPQAATPADRHILIGLTLLAAALMAATTFGLWRWQLYGLTIEANRRGE